MEPFLTEDRLTRLFYEMANSFARYCLKQNEQGSVDLWREFDILTLTKEPIKVLSNLSYEDVKKALSINIPCDPELRERFK